MSRHGRRHTKVDLADRTLEAFDAPMQLKQPVKIFEDGSPLRLLFFHETSDNDGSASSMEEPLPLFRRVFTRDKNWASTNHTHTDSRIATGRSTLIDKILGDSH